MIPYNYILFWLQFLPQILSTILGIILQFFAINSSYNSCRLQFRFQYVQLKNFLPFLAVYTGTKAAVPVAAVESKTYKQKASKYFYTAVYIYNTLVHRHNAAAFCHIIYTEHK